MILPVNPPHLLFTFSSLYDFAKQILKEIETWKHFPAIDEDAGDRWHLERLFTAGKYQVEKVMIAPLTNVPTHRHKSVTSFEIYVSGEFHFWVGSHLFMAHPDLKPHRRIIPISKGVWHGGNFPQGGQFLSVQQWDTSTIPHISADWEGLSISEKTLPA